MKIRTSNISFTRGSPTSETMTPWQRVRFSINIFWVREYNSECLCQPYLINQTTRLTGLLAWATGWPHASRLSTHHTDKHQPNLAHVWGSEDSEDSEAGLLQTKPRENINQQAQLVKSQDSSVYLNSESYTIFNTHAYRAAAAHRELTHWKQTTGLDSCLTFHIQSCDKYKWISN